MRIRRIARSLVVAGTVAMLSILSLATTVMAVTGGGDFPRSARRFLRLGAASPGPHSAIGPLTPAG